MGRAASLAHHLDDQGYGGIFPFAWAGVQVGEVGTRIGGERGISKRLLKLGVYQQRHPAPSEDGHGSCKIGSADLGEVVDAGVAQEALKAHDAGTGHRGELIDISGNHPTPETTVYPQLSGGGRELGVEGIEGGGDRSGVERHVDHRRDPAQCSGPGGGLKALPLRPPRLVDVHMAVDEPGHQHRVSEITRLGRGCVEHGGDVVVFDDHGGRTDSLRGQDL